MTMMIAALLLQAAAPSPEAVALGTRLAATSGLGPLLPAITAKETEDLVADHKELTDAEKAELRATGKQVAEAAVARVNATLGQEYAARLTLDELKALVAFEESPVAAARRAAMPLALMNGLAKLGEIDFKGDTLKAFCAKTGKACPKP
jgi:hypothetical protein